MSVMMIRYQVAEDGVEDVAGAVEAAFAALASRRPEGLRYSYYRAAGGTEFVAMLELDEGVENPLPGMGVAQELRATVAKWIVGEPPAPQTLDVLGSYAG
ncbi:hypothetical protein OG589_05055 [Sphaerisporangium sp. NBC_01403]|uniref:hypothetical protein n=1 Tax=Sphaerisporangium sp. NBC_01403 TaxID=2903599 RepID=UPI0032514DB6